MSYIAAQAYPWMDMYRKRGEPLDLEHAIGTCAQAGFDGWEPIIDEAAQIDELAPVLERHGLLIRTIYMNLRLHDAAAGGEVERALAVVRRARDLGTEYVVVNPTPIDWSTPLDKDDAELSVQVKNLGTLGAEIRSLGARLAYHTHASEMRAGAKELHHVLINTDPELVTWCFDGDWIYRGTGNSALAVYDLAKLYGERVTVLHIRQSQGGEWSQQIGSGDIDYRVVRDVLSAKGAAPLYVNEQIAGDPAAGLDAAAENYAASRAAIVEWFGQGRGGPGW